MKLLDWYIIKKFVSTFTFSLAILIFVAIAIDLSEKIDMFVNSGMGPWGIFVNYHLGFIPFIIVILFPVLVFISVILLTSRMAAHSEIIAIRVSGISYNRYLFPFLVCGIISMIVNWAFFNYILPPANKIRIAFEEKYRVNANNKTYFNSLYLRSDDTTFVIFKNYSTELAQAYPFYVDKIAHSQLSRRISGARISWDKKEKQWVATDVSIKSYNQAGGISSIEKLPKMHIRFSFTPEDAVLDDRLPEKLNRNQLRAYIEKERHKGTNITFLQLQAYKMDSTPFLTLILVLIAVMLSSRKVRGGTGVHIALGVALMTSYIFLDRMSSIFSTKSGFPPLWAAWTPHILCALISLAIYYRNRKSV